MLTDSFVVLAPPGTAKVGQVENGNKADDEDKGVNSLGLFSVYGPMGQVSIQLPRQVSRRSHLVLQRTGQPSRC